MTIFEDPAENQTVDLVIEIQDLQGNPISQVDIGDQFVLVASVQDIRGVSAATAGIYAVYMDVLYNRTLVSANFDSGNDLGFAVTFSAQYPNGKAGDVNTPGLVNDVGAFQQGFDPLGRPIRGLPHRVHGRGTGHQRSSWAIRRTWSQHTTFCTTTRPQSSRWPTSITGSRRSPSWTPMTVAPAAGGGTNQGEPLDVNYDGYISPIDALLVINHLNRGGTPGSRLDVNHDKYVSPIDALLVVNYLNRRDGSGEGEGEGEGSYMLLAAGGGESTSNDLLNALPLGTTLDVLAPVAGGAVLAPTAETVSDWQVRVGQAAVADKLPDIADITHEQWESLLDTLAEDVLEAWLGGEDA